MKELYNNNKAKIATQPYINSDGYKGLKYTKACSTVSYILVHRHTIQSSVDSQYCPSINLLNYSCFQKITAVTAGRTVAIVIH